MFRAPRLAAPAAACLLFALASVPHAAVRIDPLQDEGGTYKVYFRDRLLGTEIFSLTPHGDSVTVYAKAEQVLPMPDGDTHLEKKVFMAIRALDYGLLSYQSEQDLGGRRVLRGINVHDTTIVTFRELGDMGTAETYVRPPGRLFVVDSQMFVLFDVMLRSLHGKMVGDRPLPVVVLSEPRDSVFEIQFRPGATETVRIGGKDRTARRVVFSDGTLEFVAWISPRGSMLRLEQPTVGLRVDRVPDPPAAGKSAPASSTPKPAAPPPGR